MQIFANDPKQRSIIKQMVLNPIPEISFKKSPDLKLGFEIVPLDEFIKRPKKRNLFRDNPHRVTFYHIMIFTDGSGFHYVDFQKTGFKPGCIIFVAKNQVQSFDLQKGVKGFLIMFTEKFLSDNLFHTDFLYLYQLYQNRNTVPAYQIPQNKRSGIYQLAGNILEEYLNKDERFRTNALQLLMRYLLIKIERLAVKVGNPWTDPSVHLKFSELMDVLENNGSVTRNVDELATLINISYKKLNHICKSITGQTAKRFVDQYFILEIKRYLSMSDDSINQVSNRFGFDEPTNFIKFFKKHTGQRPFEFKTALKN